MVEKWTEQLKRKPGLRKGIITLSGAAVFVLFTLYTFVFSDSSSKLNVEKDRLTISEVKRVPFQEYIPITGTVEPIQTFYLDLSDGGKVLQEFVEEGAMLKAGDPIIRLENRSYPYLS